MRGNDGPALVTSEGRTATCLNLWVRKPESQYEASVDEAKSRRIAGLIGPTMIVMIVSELPLVQPYLYDALISPLVYLMTCWRACAPELSACT
jgi:hypothetical protein